MKCSMYTGLYVKLLYVYTKCIRYAWFHSHQRCAKPHTHTTVHTSISLIRLSAACFCCSVATFCPLTLPNDFCASCNSFCSNCRHLVYHSEAVWSNSYCNYEEALIPKVWWLHFEVFAQLDSTDQTWPQSTYMYKSMGDTALSDIHTTACCTQCDLHQHSPGQVVDCLTSAVPLPPSVLHFPPKYSLSKL